MSELDGVVSAGVANDDPSGAKATASTSQVGSPEDPALHLVAEILDSNDALAIGAAAAGGEAGRPVSRATAMI